MRFLRCQWWKWDKGVGGLSLTQRHCAWVVELEGVEQEKHRKNTKHKKKKTKALCLGSGHWTNGQGNRLRVWTFGVWDGIETQANIIGIITTASYDSIDYDQHTTYDFYQGLWRVTHA